MRKDSFHNDIERLRALGYPVNATPGAAGRYWLSAGTAREPPEGDVAAFVSSGLATATWEFRAQAKVHAPAE
ncbi:hypothetical protein [Actinomadura sp. 6N118]|uniref:hypothetical protein n=1 Tax=Actinomadura sp. 6N118 TaxID=3375151 RepID=UPI003794241E